MPLAGNLLLFGTSEGRVARMAARATAAIRKWGPERKPTSLELLLGIAVETRSSTVPVPGGGPNSGLAFEVVGELVTLGARLSRKGATE
eukprot:3307469-Lingulodinium_polyedra.AAC.1